LNVAVAPLVIASPFTVQDTTLLSLPVSSHQPSSTGSLKAAFSVECVWKRTAEAFAYAGSFGSNRESREVNMHRQKEDTKTREGTNTSTNLSLSVSCGTLSAVLLQRKQRR
jgi:hypothetical protein